MHTDESIEQQIRENLKGSRLPGAPESVRAQNLVDRGGSVRARLRGPAAGVGIPVAVVLLVPVLILALRGFAQAPVVRTPAQTGATESTATPMAAAQSMTVGELLEARSQGKIKGEQVVVSGFWTDRRVMLSCAVPDGKPGALELYCQDGQFGITQLDEPIIELAPNGDAIRPRGPSIIPWVPDSLVSQLLSTPERNGQWPAPVPIVVSGHFDDPRAAACRPQAQLLCKDRLVLDHVLNLGAAVSQTPTPVPTPFPSPAPAGKFSSQDCFGDVAYSFVGWTTTDALEVPLDRAGHVWAMVTADVVPLGGWSDDPVQDPSRKGHEFRWLGRGVCLAEEFEPGISYSHVTGTSFQEWDDGERTPGEAP